jgi:hypothetical protein
MCHLTGIYRDRFVLVRVPYAIFQAVDFYKKNWAQKLPKK